MYQSLPSHKLVYDGGFSNFDLPFGIQPMQLKFCVASATRYVLLL